MSNMQETIRLLGADLDIGAAHAGLLCPRCNGGRTREGSMRVWRVPTGLRYRCYRNKCGAYGYVPDVATSGLSAQVRRRQERQRKPREYYGPSVPLPAHHVRWYRDYFGIDSSMLEFARVSLDTKRARHVWPVHDPFMRVRGHELRAASESWSECPIPAQEPKALLFWNGAQPRCSWYRMSSTGGRLVLVEDQRSALKASRVVDTCALLGTSLNEDVANEIAREGYSEILLCLDQDATAEAYKLARRYANTLPLKPVPIPRDLKDLSYDEIMRLVG